MKSLFSLLALSAGILLGGETLAQQSTQLTPEQQRTVRLIKKIDYKINDASLSSASRGYDVEKMVKDIDPILVSKYMVFSKDWLKVIGNDRSKQVTREQFKTWTDSLDKVYECYEEFMGKGPIYTDMIFVGTSSFAIANAGTNHIQFDINRLGSSRYTILDMRRGTPGYLMLHEMGHVFSKAYAQYVPRELAWMGNDETATRLLTAYALEQGGFKIGTETGPQRRYGIVNNALRNYRFGKIDDFKYEEGSAYDLYMLSLPNFVGWDTIKKTVQSYDKNNNTYTKTKTYDPGNNKQGYHDEKSLSNSRAHEFFDRIAYFHDQACELAKTDSKVMQGIPQIGRNLTGDQVFNSFPDRGALRAKYFTVETYPLDYVKPVSAPVAAAPPPVVPKPVQKPVNKPAVSVPKTAVSKSKLPTIVPKPVQKPTPPAVPPEEEIKTLQAEIKILQDKLDSLPKTRASEPEMIRLYNDLAPLQNRLNVLMK